MDVNLKLYDFESYLVEEGINYVTEGKNVTSGWIELNCPFCSDPSHHLGVSQQGIYHCWRCGSKGSIIKLVMEIEKSSYTKALKKLEGYYLKSLKELKQDIKIRHNHEILPKEASKNFPPDHLFYLQSRNFNQEVIDKYNLFACYNLGNYKFRIICPVYLNNYIVNFTAMAVSGQAPKYKHCPNEAAIIPMKECIYNIDSVKSYMVIMEGITDVWRFGDGGVATMGIEFTPEQINHIIRKGVDKCFVMYDPEELAQRRANQLAHQLSSFINHVEVLDIGGDKDPGDLSDKEMKQIKKEIGV